jgi:hypothetical protein
MKSHAIPRFWRLFHALPADAQRLAVMTFRLWQRNPNHPSLRYRRLANRENLVTVRIGNHAEYDQLLIDEALSVQGWHSLHDPPAFEPTATVLL